MSKYYKCENCGGRFETDWSDDEAKAEMADNFPGLAAQESAIVCDDCYREMMGLPPYEPEVET